MGVVRGFRALTPNVKTLCNFEPQIWPEMITLRDAESACFKGPRTSCDVIIFGVLGLNFGKSMSIGVLWAGLRAAMWITYVGGKFRYGLLEKSLNLKTGNAHSLFHKTCRFAKHF